MMWVKLTLVPDVRVRCWFRSVRFTWRSFAGTVRTLVAVGTDKEASMLRPMRRAAPDKTIGLGSGSATELATAGTEANGATVAAGSPDGAGGVAGSEIPAAGTAL